MQPHRTSAALVAAAAAGDPAAWNELVDRYSGLLWAVARAHRLGDADARDAAQATWLRLIEHVERIRDPERIGAWLATTMRRQCLRLLPRASRCAPCEDVDQLAGEAPGSIDAGLLRDERDAILWRAFSRLPARDQALLRLLTAEPAPSYEEIAAALDMPIGSIGPTRGRALERLRRILRDAEALALDVAVGAAGA
jgi:RNA polymerase sigma factor (sigma-70 family)